MLAPVIQITAARAVRTARRPVAVEMCALNQALERLALRQVSFAAACQRDWLRFWWGV